MKTAKLITVSMLLLISTTYIKAQDMDRKKSNIQATYKIEINAPIDKVWEVLAVDYAGIGKWASGVNHVVESSGEGITAKRFCSISASGFNDTRERVIKFEPENHYFEYELYEGLPGFVKYSINKDKLVAKGNKTIWISTNDMRVGGFMGLTMKWMMRKQLTKVLENKAQELKYFVETGKPHSRKVNIMKNKAIKDTKMREKVMSVVVERDIDAPIDRVWEVYGKGFADISKSHPDCPHSEWSPGHDTAQEGAMRVMYMTDSRKKKYFVDKIAKYNPEKYHITIEIVDKKGYANMNKEYTWVNMDAEEITEKKTRLKIRFNYLTKPKFFKGLAKGPLRKAFERYAYGIDYYAKTGEPVTKKKWKEIKHLYR
ncbi:SRPBCC family protein [Aquimarina sp. 2304DJ70-9]|uniref:SRPBCC family protein n=1 Tax=Aquimarina penaris TaxID=3231044 RepID=UPI003461C5BC